MRKWMVLGLLIAGLVALLPAAPVLAGETVGNQGSYFPQPGNRKIDGNLWVTGDLFTGAEKTDGSVFLSALDVCKGDTTNLAVTRVAANNWALARTATAAETINYVCNLNSWLQRYGGTTGIKITSLALSYQITVLDATTHTGNGLKTVVYAHNTANTVGSALATITLATASTTNPYLTTITPTTAAYLPAAANTALTLDGTIVLATTGVFRLYGVQVNFTRADQ